MELSVKIDVFEGPLDLLLHLIEKNKVTITDIPIFEITEQYLAYIDQLQSNQMEVMSEFVDMAATLIGIKVKMLLPQQKNENDEVVDPRYELMLQLLEYKKYKMMAQRLKDKQEYAEQVFYKEPTIPKEIEQYLPKVDTDKLLSEVEFSSLYAVFKKLMKKNADKIDPVRSKFGTIKNESFKVKDKMKFILKHKKKAKTIQFEELFDQDRTRAEMVATFLAILELMKATKIRVVQENIFHQIVIEFI